MMAAFRLIVLTSGSFWGTYIPSWIMRISVLSTGSTWEELDNRVFVWKTIVVRVHMIILSSVASALNPIIYFGLQKDFRVALRRSFGGRSKFSWESEATENTAVD